MKIEEGEYYVTQDGFWYAKRYMPNQNPVRTVTRKEIVPGVYGKVKVLNDGEVGMLFTSSADELTAAIETLTGIRDAMLEGAGK